MICEIINPSDPYTLVADDFTVAAVAIAVLGRGRLGLSCDGESSPVLFGWDEWFRDRGIDDLSAYVAANRAGIAGVLESVLIGPKAQRADAESMLAMLPAEDRARWLAERHDRRRSSMNDIGAAAIAWAAKLRENDREPRP